jgi:hypothetical protein
MDDTQKFYLTASIKMEKETDELKQEVASVIDLPEGKEKQPDLSYFSAIFVSSGENLNHAYFLGSELVDAAESIVSKALDVEHEEQEIIGHLYSYAFTDESGSQLNMTELASTETATLDSKNMHIQIGSIVYKNRFPEIAKEIADNEWMVSMECYYKDFDVKIGDLIITRDTANSIGIEVSNDEIYGKSGKVIKDGKEIASGTIARVLRGICFSGCGIVKNPANPPSVVLEVATKDIETMTFYMDEQEETASTEEPVNNVTSKEVESVNFSDEEESALTYDDTVGICVSYKKRFEDKEGSIIAENWCSEFSTTCTSASRDASDQGCLRNIAMNKANAYVEKLLEDRRNKIDTKGSLNRLLSALEKADKFKMV